MASLLCSMRSPGGFHEHLFPLSAAAAVIQKSSHFTRLTGEDTMQRNNSDNDVPKTLKQTAVHIQCVFNELELKQIRPSTKYGCFHTIYLQTLNKLAQRSEHIFWSGRVRCVCHWSWMQIKVYAFNQFQFCSWNVLGLRNPPSCSYKQHFHSLLC